MLHTQLVLVQLCDKHGFLNLRMLIVVADTSQTGGLAFSRKRNQTNHLVW